MWTITVAGVDRSEYFDLEGFSVERTLNGRSVFRATTRDNYGGWTPLENDTIVLEQDGTTEFGGIITEVSCEPAFGDVGLVTSLVAADYHYYASRVYIDNLTIPSGSHVIDILNDLITNYLGEYGITLDGSQATGAETLGDITWDLKSVEEALNEMSTGTGWVWQIDFDKQLRMYDPTTQACPNAVDTTPSGACNPGVIVTRNANTFANVQKVRIGSASTVMKTEVFTANGFARTWQTTYIPAEPLPGTTFVWMTYSAGPVPNWGDAYIGIPVWFMPFGPGATPILWDASGRSLYMAAWADTPPSGTTIQFEYPATFPMTIVAEASGIAPGARVERLSAVPDCYDYYSGVTIAEGLLRRSLVIPTEVEFTDFRSGFAPGQVVNIDLPNRGLSGDFLITDVTITAESQYALLFTIKCVSGSETSGTWMDKFRQWNQMSGGGGNASAGWGGIFEQTGTGGGGAGMWYLGGSRFHAVQLPEA